MTSRGMIYGDKFVPGVHTDKLNIEAGVRQLEACGYSEVETKHVIAYALARWTRGEEEAAQRMAIDKTFHGIDCTSWIRVLSAAKAAAYVEETK